jgi:small subunit ribosomal protein S20
LRLRVFHGQTLITPVLGAPRTEIAGGLTLPNVKSAEKRMRTNEIRAERNRQARSRLRTALKKVRGADTAEAGTAALQEAISLIDRAARKRLIHPNKAARAKSRLSVFVKKLSA